MSFILYDKLRMFLKRNDIYAHENLLQNQSDLAKIITKNGNNILDIRDPSFLVDQSNVQINRLDRYKDYDMMNEVGEITLALDLYADEISLRDPERNHSIFVKTSSIRLKNEVEDFLYNTLNVDAQIRPIARYLCKYGDFPCEIVPNSKRDGVSTIKQWYIYNFTRIETKYSDLVGFFYQPEGEEPKYYHPWQVCHMRLTNFEQIFHPYGYSILEGARRDFRRLRLMEDAAIVYRLVRASEKRIFKVPCGSLPPKEREQYIETIARRFKKHKFIDPVTGALNERYAPHIQDDDYWVPVTSDGQGVEIDTLSGAENLDQIADIEYFKKKMVAALKIPFSRVGLPDESSNSNRSVASQSPEFAKAVQWIQDQIIVGIKKIVIVHLSLRGYTINDIKNFELGMTSASAIDELYRIETWGSRVEIMGGLKELGIFPDEWIVESFTHMTKDELELIQKKMELEGQVNPKEEEEGGKEEDQEFFDEKHRIGNLLLEQKKAEIKDLANKIEEIKSRHTRHASAQKLLNENEFDGLECGGQEIESNVLKSDRELLITESKEFLISMNTEGLEEDPGDITDSDIPIM